MQFDALYAMVKSNLASEIEAVKENKQKLQKKGGCFIKKCVDQSMKSLHQLPKQKRISKNTSRVKI